MPLMREFGELARKRVGVGVTPLEYQRYLDLRGRIGKCFTDKGSIQSQGRKRRVGQSNLTRLALSYPNRAALVSYIIDNIKPAGIMVCRPFAADVGTHFLPEDFSRARGRGRGISGRRRDQHDSGSAYALDHEHGHESQDRKDESSAERGALEALRKRTRPTAWLGRLIAATASHTAAGCQCCGL